eukprot:TRINITY_DN11706_c0_g1_i1.p1 TRINITY_DN11706_c0_g1~~TRINITY_DN11706_c0_g1_i1.p1  ORF type:complete len:104 (+),score=4.01 TRINITY_DN11706_c0_g1_i1:57-368(+)
MFLELLHSYAQFLNKIWHYLIQWIPFLRISLHVKQFLSIIIVVIFTSYIFKYGIFKFHGISSLILILFRRFSPAHLFFSQIFDQLVFSLSNGTDCYSIHIIQI